jgi:hypothetical protein
MTRWVDRLAFLLAILTALAAYAVGVHYFENLPHLEDEMAYTWQAKADARGVLLVPAPACIECFRVPFVVSTADGYRTSKYPPGWSAALALGELTGLRNWVNPFLAGLCAWFTYRLARRFLAPMPSVLAELLLAISPVFLIQAGSLLGHVLSLFLLLVFSISWLDGQDSDSHIPAWLSSITAITTLGLLILTRPLTALAGVFPFLIHGLWRLLRGTPSQRKWVMSVGVGTLPFVGLYLLWQFAVTGNPFHNPYQMWWSYDTVGFGPNAGLKEGGYWFKDAIVNIVKMVKLGASDLFGWKSISWILLPFGMVALFKRGWAWLIFSVFPALVVGYGFYWISATLYGPRYYVEALPGIAIFSAAGFNWLAGNAFSGKRWRTLPVPNGSWLLAVALLGFLIGRGLFTYLPERLNSFVGLNNTSQARLEPFRAAVKQGLAPAIVIVHWPNYWTEWGGLVDLNSPFLDTPLLVASNRDQAQIDSLIQAFPDYSVYHYFSDSPWNWVQEK